MISRDEFECLQEQLLELRTANYDLLEVNRKLTAASKENEKGVLKDPFGFANKLIGAKLNNGEEMVRRQEAAKDEEFRLQQQVHTHI